ncbi:MAG: hypothetical protein ACYTG0_10900 [Planctomycetota bacterium]|jgi:hypothetical protein
METLVLLVALIVIGAWSPRTFSIGALGVEGNSVNTPVGICQGFD